MGKPGRKRGGISHKGGNQNQIKRGQVPKPRGFCAFVGGKKKKKNLHGAKGRENSLTGTVENMKK